MSKKIPDTELVQSLAQILKDHELGEIEYSHRQGKLDDIRVRITAQNHTRTAVVSQIPEAITKSHDLDISETSEMQITSTELADHPGAVAAPMVGTIYLQAEPEAPPFIELGQTVEEGDTLFIIEAMKTMNHIPAPKSGTVRRILVENSSIVEFGATLAIID